MFGNSGYMKNSGPASQFHYKPETSLKSYLLEHIYIYILFFKRRIIVHHYLSLQEKPQGAGKNPSPFVTSSGSTSE